MPFEVSLLRRRRTTDSIPPVRVRDSGEWWCGKQGRDAASRRFPGVEFFGVPEAIPFSRLEESLLQPLRIPEPDAMQVVIGYLGDPLTMVRNIDPDSREPRMYVPDREDRHRPAMRRERFHQLRDTSQGNRLAKDLTACLVIRVPHAPYPGVSPGKEPIRLNLAKEPGNLDYAFPVRSQLCIVEVEEARLHSQDLTRPTSVFLSPTSNFPHRKWSECLRLLTASQPDDDHPVATRSLRQNRSSHTYLIVRMGHADEQRLSRGIVSPWHQDHCSARLVYS